jgi:hypothetical protein
VGTLSNSNNNSQSKDSKGCINTSRMVVAGTNIQWLELDLDPISHTLRIGLRMNDYLLL